MSGPASRRAILRGLAIGLPAIGAPAGALALAAPRGPHPNAGLLAAEAELIAARRAAAVAVNAHRTALRAMRDAQHPCPDELFLNAEEQHISERWARFGYMVIASRYRWERRPTTPWHTSEPAWRGQALSEAIKYAVPDRGRGGRTPHLIRRWRGLLPTAQAYDAHLRELWDRHPMAALTTERRRAEKAAEEARARMALIPATTVDGLAAHVRRFQGSCLSGTAPNIRTLILSAAAVSGVPLEMSEDDL